MIWTVTPNAAVDRTFRVPRVVPGDRVVAHDERAQAGGKGVNVARALHGLGVPVGAVVLVGGEAGRFVVEDLERTGIETVAVPCPGESRTCVELVDDDGRATQVHGRGVRAGEAEARALADAVERTAGGASWVAVCGSLAPGLPDDTAARILVRARAQGARTAVDGHGPALAAAISAAPDLVRVNRDEWRGSGLGEPDGPAARAISDGPGAGAISDGPRPIVAWCAGRRLRVAPPSVDGVNPIGCGDAMLAGLLARLAEGAPFEAALRFGVALAAADAESPVAGRPDGARARTLLDAVVVEPDG